MEPVYYGCPMCEAPACFRFTLTRCLEQPAHGYSPTNWRGFADHFTLGLEQGAEPEDVIRYWVESHPNHHRHTIAVVMAYAEAKEHRRLQEAFSRLISSEYTISLSSYYALQVCCPEERVNRQWL